MKYHHYAACAVIALTLFSACLHQPADKASGTDNGAAQMQQLIDTEKLKNDLNDVVNSLSSGKPDTTKLKNAGADVLSTAANVLSDSGISKLYGNSNDPAVNSAKNALIKMRNAMGITSSKLDSMKESAKTLSSSGH